MERQKNIDSLDLLKGLSAILIVFHHYQQSFGCTFNGINFYSGRINFGFLVELFFMISGYLTIYTGRNLQRHATITPNLMGAGVALLHKFKRIYPMATITIVFCLAVKTIDANVINDAEKVAEMWNVKALIGNFLLLFCGWPGLSMIGYNNPLWYLCILIQCYLVFYIIRFICSCVKEEYSRIVEFGLWFIVVILTIVLRNVIAYGQYRGIQAFGIGLLLCPTLITIESKIQESANGQDRLKRIRAIVIYVLSGITILTISFTCWKQGLQREVLIIGVFIPVLVIAYVLRNWESSIARFFGRISFELFIWHAPMMAFVKLLFHLNGVESFPHSYLTMVAFTGLMILWAWFMYEQLEIKIAAMIKANEIKRRISL